jgi:2-iminobutanoate/2-iminopropanoate deaminase
MKKKVQTDQAPAAIGPYSQAITVGNFIFVSGQLGTDPVSGEFTDGDVGGQTRQVFANIEAILRAAGSDIGQIVKVTIFLADMNDFAVVNEVYAQHVTKPYPARACIQAAALPKGAKVEIEVCAIKKYA